MSVALRCPGSSVRRLELGSSTDVGRGDLSGNADFVSRRQATIVVTESGVEVRSLGSNPTGMRSDANAPWSWLSKGQVAAAHPPPLQLCLDKKNQFTTLLTLEPGEPATEEVAAEASAAPSSESAGSDVHITSTRTRDERDAEARRNAIDVEAIDDAPAPPPSTEPTGKRVKAEPGTSSQAVPPPTAPLPTAPPKQRPARPSADAEFEMLESAGLVSFGGGGLGFGGGGFGFGGGGSFPPAAARVAAAAPAAHTAAAARAAAAAPAARATPQSAEEPIELDDSDETDEDDEVQQQQQREAMERRAQAAARTRSGLYAPTPQRPRCRCDGDCSQRRPPSTRTHARMHAHIMVCARAQVRRHLLPAQPEALREVRPPLGGCQALLPQPAQLRRVRRARQEGAGRGRGGGAVAVTHLALRTLPAACRPRCRGARRGARARLPPRTRLPLPACLSPRARARTRAPGAAVGRAGRRCRRAARRHAADGGQRRARASRGRGQGEAARAAATQGGRALLQVQRSSHVGARRAARLLAGARPLTIFTHHSNASPSP